MCSRLDKMSHRDLPPISVITTSTSSSTSQKISASHSSNGSGKANAHCQVQTSDQNNTPIILIKTSKKKSQTETNPEGTAAVPTPSRPLDYAPTGSTAVVNRSSNDLLSHSMSVAASEEDDKQIDSALLSALQDGRERIALLRLEKNLIDFMNDKTCGYMEVGGPGNSIVIRGASGGNGSSNLDIDPDGTPGKKTNMNSCGGNDIASVVGRQTSFQRLCLHRLADRFKIVREQVFHNHNPNAYYMNQNLGLIRLVKVKESRIPSVMLIDVDVSQYEHAATPQDREDSPSMAKVADQLSGICLQDGSSGNKKSKKKEKVKIMKRSSSSALTTASDKSIKSKSIKRKSKNLSDKEKAYAEARARIFNSTESDSGTNNMPETSEHADSSGSVDATPPGSANRSTTSSPVPTKIDSKTGGNNAECTASSVSEAPTGSTASNGDKTSSKRGGLPAAVTGVAASKVTWRNREQEASDPDFRRGRHSVMMHGMPMPLQMQYQGYLSHTGTMGHGHAIHSAGGYQYGTGVVDGQSFHPNLAYYGPAAPPMYHADVPLQRPYHSPTPHDNRFQERRVTVDGSVTSRSQKIDLSTEEFPALS